eukprot:scaffold90964_cov30-Tisochrysis_lutea.AAC.1
MDHGHPQPTLTRFTKTPDLSCSTIEHHEHHQTLPPAIKIERQEEAWAHDDHEEKQWHMD